MKSMPAKTHSLLSGFETAGRATLAVLLRQELHTKCGAGKRTWWKIR